VKIMCSECGRVGYHHPNCPDYEDPEPEEQDCFDAFKEEREWDQRTSTPPE
jgi:hypothetical protein